MPKLSSTTDTATSTTTNNKGKGKALQPISVATRVLPPRKRVSALASSSNNISPSSSSITSRSTSASSTSPPPPPALATIAAAQTTQQATTTPSPPVPTASLSTSSVSSTSSSSSSSASSLDGIAPTTTTTATTIRRLSERKSHLHPSYIAYSPRADPTLYIDQLDTPMSDVRENKRRARPISSFSELNLAPPVPSKRSRHHPRSRIHHAQQKYQERQEAAAAAAAAAAKAAASSIAYRQRQQEKQEQQQLSPPRPQLQKQVHQAQQKQTQQTAQAQHKHQQQKATLSFSSKSSSATAAAQSSIHRRGPEYAYPRDSLQVHLTQDLPVIDDKQLNEKAKEKEYWRRQRRVFVRSRFITNEEATAIANSVYKSNPVGPQDRIVVTFQANIANFRSKWRKLLKELVKRFSVSRNMVTAQDSEPFEREVRSKVDTVMLQRVWGHWLSDPFIDEEVFYANPQNVETLTAVTVQAICVTLRYHYGFMKERDFRKQLDDLDRYTRNLELPDPFSSVQ